MYTLEYEAPNGTTLNCRACLYTLRVNDFNNKNASPRTLAATAMWKHMGEVHGKIALVNADKPAHERPR